MPETHAKLSPSSADRWVRCPGSVPLSEGMPSKSSAFADEGTKAHGIAEEWLLTGACPPCEDAMREAAKVYVHECMALVVAQPGNVLAVEKKVSVAENIWGTADAIVWAPTTETLYVRDLKYGAGVGVEVEGNLQLKIYGLAALLTMKYPARTVNVGIVQPRYGHPEGAVRTVEFDSIDLIDFHADLLDAAARVEEARCAKDLDGFLEASEKGCRWCLAAPKCPKIQAKAQQLAKQVFAPGLPYDAKALAETLDFLGILEGWIKNVREFAYAEAEGGRTAPGYKLVEKRATRKWRETVDVTLLAKKLKQGVEVFFKPQELIPVGEVLKMCPGKNAAERELLIEQFTTKERSGLALVHESDKRSPVNAGPQAAFSDK